MGIYLPTTPFRRISAANPRVLIYRKAMGLDVIAGVCILAGAIYAIYKGYEKLPAFSDPLSIIVVAVCFLMFVLFIIIGEKLVFGKHEIQFHQDTKEIKYFDVERFALKPQIFSMDMFKICSVVERVDMDQEGDSHTTYQLVLIGNGRPDLVVWVSTRKEEVNVAAKEINSFVGWISEPSRTTNAR